MKNLTNIISDVLVASWALDRLEHGKVEVADLSFTEIAAIEKFNCDAHPEHPGYLTMCPHCVGSEISAGVEAVIAFMLDARGL